MIIFFFFNDLNQNSLIQQALQIVCGDKLAKDGYCDMSEYIYARIDKNEVLSELLKSNSIFSELYNMPYPKEDTACDDLVTFLNEHFGKDIKSKTNYTLTYLEAKAIVNWIYRAYSNATKRKEETVNLLSDFDENYSVGKLEFIHDIIYIKSEIEINLISSFERFYQCIKDIETLGNVLFYRGHADVNYTLLPSVMRRKSWLEHECDLYNETIIECPNNFEKCHTHL